ncbi:hypothetical protein E0H52_17650 [Rhizobium leguminosarum bv. viciae]|nr:hypothetical protein [Rhizobium leguminosarum bv. viciae]TBZ18881.1 hypothetical protein E0H52_17650 [Rhizobium leguminosarum bv. viciae]
MRCITGGPSAACYAADDVSAGGGCFLVCAGDRPSSGCRHLTGVEPLVSTRPSDPRKRGEGTMPRPLDSLFSPRGEEICGNRSVPHSHGTSLAPFTGVRRTDRDE